MGRKSLLGLTAIAALVATLSAPAGAAVVLSDFASGADGWRTADMGSDGYHPSGTLGTANYVASGQYIQTTDTLDWVGFLAPGKFLGNLSSFAGGRLGFDLQDTLSDGASYLNVAITSVTGPTIYIVTAPPSTSAFTHFEFTLGTASAWRKSPSTLATAADFTNLLNNVTGIYISADWRSGPDDSRLDNVCLRSAGESSCVAAAVPEPGGMALAGLGLALAGWVGRRRKGSRSPVEAGDHE